mgnify:CR=1 FL=1
MTNDIGAESAKAGIEQQALTAIENDVASEKKKLKHIFQVVVSHPIKLIAAFMFAPFLMVRVAWVVQNPIRRKLAVIGLLLSFLGAFRDGTFLGSVAGAIFVGSNVGVIAGFGVLVGTTISVVLSVTFSIFVFNVVSFTFLKMNTQEVVDYLREISE